MEGVNFFDTLLASFDEGMKLAISKEERLQMELARDFGKLAVKYLNDQTLATNPEEVMRRLYAVNKGVACALGILTVIATAGQGPEKRLEFYKRFLKAEVEPLAVILSNASNATVEAVRKHLKETNQIN